jgi:hypothetical protein
VRYLVRPLLMSFAVYRVGIGAVALSLAAPGALN